MMTRTVVGESQPASVCSLLISGSAFSSEPGSIPFNFPNICFALGLAQPSVRGPHDGRRALCKAGTHHLEAQAECWEWGRGAQGRQGELLIELGWSWRSGTVMEVGLDSGRA